ncbi:pilus assembly protein CpaB [Rubricella aquisinus]|uniref:Pilus assembly protein CpaB n=1 Tax=Rubricella aquisinus TaxID=2028108 RepID=A0A840WLJ9_9RHOB|nr:Flp pilus assembly protein CpaB [Rubricella aquisinus]MBB5515929.1 pilus assembly protein CpaB [Rubricella aquisinus]
MRIVFLLVLALGIGLAGFAVYVVSNQFETRDQQLARIQQMQQQAPPPIETVDVIVAAKELSYGDILTANDLKVAVWPAEFQPEGVFDSAAAILEAVDDRIIVLRAIDVNEPITTKKITGFGLDAGVAARLEAGKRAFTIRVDVASGVSGFLTPGDRVDVFWTGRDGRSPVTRLILDGIRLIAVDQTANQDTNRPIIARTITVEATPQEAAILAQAQSSGKLSLSLRGISDTTVGGAVEVSQDDIVGRVAPPPSEPEPEAEPEPEPEPVQRTIRIRRAGELSIVPAD